MDNGSPGTRRPAPAVCQVSLADLWPVASGAARRAPGGRSTAEPGADAGPGAAQLYQRHDGGSSRERVVRGVVLDWLGVSVTTEAGIAEYPVATGPLPTPRRWRGLEPPPPW
jgi:hypothetical protein